MKEGFELLINPVLTEMKYFKVLLRKRREHPGKLRLCPVRSENISKGRG
jgi:hypothetical protein